MEELVDIMAFCLGYAPAELEIVKGSLFFDFNDCIQLQTLLDIINKEQQNTIEETQEKTCKTCGYAKLNIKPRYNCTDPDTLYWPGDDEECKHWQLNMMALPSTLKMEEAKRREYAKELHRKMRGWMCEDEKDQQ
jgi:hypothetical protein